MSNLNPHKDHRRAPREDVTWKTQLHGGALRPMSAMVVNISIHGCMVRCEADVKMGEPLTVRLPVVGNWVGRVVWALGGRIGMEFAMPLPLDHYMEMLSQMDHDPTGMNF